MAEKRTREFVSIDGYPLDLFVRESHSFRNEVEKNPVERGPDIADHIRVLPDEMTLDGIVSDTPIGAIATHQTRNPLAGAPLISQDAYLRLKAIRDQRRVVVVVTSLGKFDDMAVTELTVPREAKNTHGLEFSITLEHMRIVDVLRVHVDVPSLGKLGPKKETPLAVINVRSASIYNRRVLQAQGFQLVAVTSHDDRIATFRAGVSNGPFAQFLPSSPDAGFDPFDSLGRPGLVAHFKDETLPDGFLVGDSVNSSGHRNYLPYSTRLEQSTGISIVRPIKFDDGRKTWTDADNNLVTKTPTNGEAYKKLTSVQQPRIGNRTW